jgi:hypothetical protein
MTEDEHSIALMSIAQTNPITKKYLIHIPNQRKCSAAYGAKLKKMGVKKGVSDYFLAYPVGDVCGLWLELKVPAEKIMNKSATKATLEQCSWINRMSLVGYQAQFVFGWPEAWLTICEYLGIKCNISA